MTDKIVVVTPPDDVLIDGFRILLVDFSESQASFFSQFLLSCENPKQTIITYHWRCHQDYSWVIDKKHKSNLILVNAESENQIIVGYFIAQPNCYYFGSLKNLSVCNPRLINSDDYLKNLFLKNNIL